jgi:hypothetical protein
LFLETTLVLLEESPIQCNSVLHDNRNRSFIWSYFLAERTTDVSISSHHFVTYITALLMVGTSLLGIEQEVQSPTPLRILETRVTKITRQKKCLMNIKQEKTQRYNKQQQ